MRPSPQQIEDFVRYARSPSTWASAARKQLAVAEILQQRKLTYKAGASVPTEEYAGCVSAMYFHLGLALESSAKAFLVARDPTVITEAGQIDRKKLGSKGGHGLIGLCELVLPDLNPKELQLLAKLQEHVIWLGKYGTPMDATPLFDAALMDIIRVSTPDEWPMARSIFERINSTTRGAHGDA